MTNQNQTTTRLGIVLNQTFNLKAEDLRNLEQNFVTREIAELAKLRRVDSITGAEIVGKREKAGFDYSGLVFPYFLPPSYSSARQYRLRRDKPDYEQNGNGAAKEIAKYLSAPGAVNSFYFPPNVKAEWLKDVSLPIVITEGEKKGLALYRLASENLTLPDWHFLPIALSGVWNFRSSNVGKITGPNGERVNVKGIIPDFGLVTLKGRDVIILFDANVHTNPDVKMARFQLAEVLSKKGARVSFAELPKDCRVNGIDDYLGAEEMKNGFESAIVSGLELIRAARSFEKTKLAETSNFELITDGEKAGVYFKDESGERFLICSPLEIVAETHTEEGKNYGRLLRWQDSKGRAHVWAMPIELIHGESFEFIKRLTGEGLELMPTKKHREKLSFYIATSKPDKTITCTDRIGWHGKAFVLPNETFGAGFDEIIFQSAHEGFHKFGVKGSLKDWQENVSKYCIGNSRLAFAVSVAFASPLLKTVDVQGGGFHYRGLTSTGKTTALLVGGSVCGGSETDSHGFCQTWKATANGLEAVAESHNHALLCLDEIGECDGRQVGEIAYMLANGHGKNRMARTVTARRSLTWNLLFLSSGEQRLSDKMRESGQTVKGGQEVRLCDIEAETGAFGLFENLHGFASGQEFSDKLRTASKEYYGAAIREYLRLLATLDHEAIKKNWREFQQKFIAEVLPEKDYPPEIYRAATRFALIAFAGEIATKFNITAWNAGEASTAVRVLFKNWLDGRSEAGTDAENAVRQVRNFLELHGQSRFQDTQSAFQTVSNRAGFRRKNATTDETEFLIYREVFRSEVCKNFDAKFVAGELAARGFLIKGSDGKNTRNERIDGKQQRFFVLNGDIFEAVETGGE